MASSRLSAAWSPRTRAASLLRSTLPSAVVPGNAASIAATASPSYSRCTTASASCTGTPSSTKKRAVVDFPMPSEPVRPRMNMPPRLTNSSPEWYPLFGRKTPSREQPEPRDGSCREPSRLPEMPQQRQQRKSQNDEVIALDALEQLDAALLELIRPHTRGDRGSRSIEIVFEKTVGKRAHGEPRRFAMLEQDRALPHESNRGVKLMRPAAQRLELLARGGPVSRLGESALAQCQRLVGAEYHSTGQTSGNRGCLLARQQRGDFAGIAGRPALLDRALVDVRRMDLDRNSRRAQDSTSDGALRRQHERLIGEPERHHSRQRLAAAFGEKAHHRRGGLLDRSSRHVDARPIVPGAQLAGERHFLGHRLAVDVLIVVVMGLETEQPVLANLHDPL